MDSTFAIVAPRHLQIELDGVEVAQMPPASAVLAQTLFFDVLVPVVLLVEGLLDDRPDPGVLLGVRVHRQSEDVVFRQPALDCFTIPCYSRVHP